MIVISFLFMYIYSTSGGSRAYGLAGQLNIELVEPVGAWLAQRQNEG
jgi:hypothetical protein